MTPHHKSTSGPICNAKGMVQTHGTLKASLLRALALANHVKTLHPSIKA